MWAASLGALCAFSLQASDADTFHPVPRASCGPQDRPEGGLQGQTTLAERFTPGDPKPFNCNLELLSQFEGEGNAGFMQLYGACAYYSSWESPTLRHPGAVVLDLSEPQQPRPSAYLDTPAMRLPNQSLEMDRQRGVLLAAQFRGSTFDLYDVSADCRRPRLIRSIELPRLRSHMGQFLPDGRTYLAASCCTRPGAPPDPNGPPVSAIFAIDTSDPNQPRHIATWIPPEANWKTHSVSVSPDSKRAYVSIHRLAEGDRNGLVILDSSEVVLGKPEPQFHLVSAVFWEDAWVSEYVLPVRIQGRPYVIFSDILGALARNGSCVPGKPAYGFTRIIDIAKERNPTTVSKLMLEVHEPNNCSKVMHDTEVLFGYGSLACDVDDRANAKLLACGYSEAGMRVFDIRNPTHPVEIAYYKPAARRTQSRPGSVIRSFFANPLATQDLTADQVMQPMFREGGDEIAFMSADNGFQIVRFSEAFKAAHPQLFRISANRGANDINKP